MANGLLLLAAQLMTAVSYMHNSIIANSIMGRKIDNLEFVPNGTGCYCLLCEEKRVSRKY